MDEEIRLQIQQAIGYQRTVLGMDEDTIIENLSHSFDKDDVASVIMHNAQKVG